MPAGHDADAPPPAGAPPHGPEEAEPEPAARDPRTGQPLSLKDWVLKDRFSLMALYLPQLETDPADYDLTSLRARFLAEVRRGRTLRLARVAVTVLLAAGILATAASAAVGAFEETPVEEVGQEVGTVFEAVAAVAGSLTVLLLVARLMLDRYIDLYDVKATFLAMQIASAQPPRRRPRGDTRARSPPPAPAKPASAAKRAGRGGKPGKQARKTP